MHINEVLQLDKTNQSIKKIDLFLSGCNKKSKDYYKATCYRNIILHSIGKTNEALKNLYALVGDFNKFDDKIIVDVCDAIIEITLDINRLDQSRKYIDIKKSHLQLSDLILNLVDEIKFSIANKDKVKAIDYLNKYLNDDLSIDEMIWAYETIVKLYYELHEEENFLIIADKLEKIYQDSLNFNKLIEILYLKLKNFYENENYVRAICDGNRILNDYDPDAKTKVLVATILIDSYLHCKDYKKAAIIESNYEEKLDSVDDSVALDFSKVSLELYTQTNSLISAKHYQDLVIKYSNAKKKTKQNIKNQKKDIIIPIVNESKQVVKEEEKSFDIKQKDIKTLYVSTNFLKLSNLYSIVNNLDENIKFREVFRCALIELSKIINFDEAYILYYNKSYNGIHYKKERAYDKRLDFNKINDTINFLAIIKEQEVFLDEDSTSGLIDIVTALEYKDIPYGIAIPLFKEDIAYASIAFFGYNQFLVEDLAYETLKLVCQMLNKYLCEEIKQNNIRRTNKRLFFICENMSSGIKELVLDDIHLSKQAKDMLSIVEDLSFNDYKSHIHPEDLPKYTIIIDSCYHQLESNKVITYRFKKNNSYIYIKETLFPSFDNGIVSIYSILDDITKEIDDKSDLINLAYTNPTTKLYSEVKLMIDLNESLNKIKLSLAVIDVYDFKLYEQLYGINFANQLIYAIALELKKAFENNFNTFIYHLEFDRYAILFKETNDKRTIENMLLKALNTVSKNISMLNNRVNLYFNCGIFRTSKNSNLNDCSKILSYAYDALEDAKKTKSLDFHICHYDGEQAKLRFNENQLITHISEAIDHGKIGISYKQVVNTNKLEIFAYYANISLDNFNVDNTYMQKVIKRRGLEEIIDKYIIGNVSKELKMLHDSLKADVYAMVDVSDITIKESFVSFVESQNDFYKTTKNKLIFVVKDANNTIVKKLKELGYLIASKNLFDLYHNYIDYFIYDIKENGFEIIPKIKKLVLESNKILIVGGIETKEDVANASKYELEYIYGDYYKKSIRVKKLIEKMA